MKKPSLFLTIENAAKESGLSLRHFRRIFYEEGQGKIMRMTKRRMFILRADFESWQRLRKKPA